MCFGILKWFVVIYLNYDQLPEAQDCNNNVKRRLLTGDTDETYPDFHDQELHMESFKHDMSELQYLSSNKSIQSERLQFPLVFERNISATFTVNESTVSSKGNSLSVRVRTGSTNDNDSANLTFEEKAREDSFHVTNPENSPYSVIVVIYTPSIRGLTCTGTLITKRWVLTAAHCIKRPQNITYVGIYAGGNSAREYLSDTFARTSQSLTSNEFYAHPRYVRGVSNYDVAVVKVNGTFRMTKYVKTITMATVPWKFKGYARCEFTGFGIVQFDEPNDIDKVRKTHKFEMKSPCSCASKIKSMQGQSHVERFLCAKPREDYGVCYGDSGGGLICDGLLWGVCMEIVMIQDMASCSVSYVDTVMCGLKNTISVFESTCPFLRWINHHVKLFNKSQISKRCRTFKGRSARTKPTLLCVLALSLINMLFFNM